MMLTLPDRGLGFLSLSLSLSLSLRLPPGVGGWERPEVSAVILLVEGDNRGDFVGETLRGGVVGRMKVGVAGMNENWGGMGMLMTWMLSVGSV